MCQRYDQFARNHANPDLRYAFSDELFCKISSTDEFSSLGVVKFQKFITGEDGQKNRTCCWSCMQCKSKEISDGETCQLCDIGMRPNVFRNGMLISSNLIILLFNLGICIITTAKNVTIFVSECVEMPHEYVRYTDFMGITSSVFSVIGIVSTVMTMMVFYKYGNTPVVKSSTKELCYIMFIGMILAHLCSFVLIGKPTIQRCTVVRIVPGISLCIMYSALLVKTNRISRILSMSKKRFPTLKPRLMSTMSQVRKTLHTYLGT